jgi:hypothetical protein
LKCRETALLKKITSQFSSIHFFQINTTAHIIQNAKRAVSVTL